MRDEVQPAGPQPPEALFEPDDEEQGEMAGKVRNRLYVVMALMMVVGSLARNCVP